MEIRESCNLRSNSSSDTGRHRVSRRELAGWLMAGAVFPRASVRLGGQSASLPEISAFDLSLLNDWTTPNQFFFIREHFPTPTISAGDWVVAVAGAVETPLEISLPELAAQPKRDMAVTIECAENPVGGGLVSHAEWTGVALADVLGRAGPLREGRFVRLTGEDGFVRNIPLEKAEHRDTLLVNQMNREKLPLVHGGPLRALIPGWYGMDSVKWLRKVEVLTEAKNESYLRRTGTGETEPITRMHVKAVFARPVNEAVLFGGRFLARGAAWAGESRVEKVEFSSDGGASWQRARLLDAAQAYAWVRWEYDWQIPSRGEFSLVVRATDDAGRSQPAKSDPGRVDQYEQNTYHRVRVTVE